MNKWLFHIPWSFYAAMIVFIQQLHDILSHIPATWTVWNKNRRLRLDMEWVIEISVDVSINEF
jgi:hypothetical protein